MPYPLCHIHYLYMSMLILPYHRQQNIFLSELQCVPTDQARKLTSNQPQRFGSQTRKFLRARAPSFDLSFEQQDCSGFFPCPDLTLTTEPLSLLSGMKNTIVIFLTNLYRAPLNTIYIFALISGAVEFGNMYVVYRSLTQKTADVLIQICKKIM